MHGTSTRIQISDTLANLFEIIFEHVQYLDHH